MLRYANQKDNDQSDKAELEKDFERPDSPTFYDQISKKISWYHKVLLDKPSKVIVVFIIFTIIVPLLVFYFLYESIHRANNVVDGFSAGTCSHNITHRVICGVENATSDQCTPNCCYDEENNFCYHYMPSRFSYVSKNGWNETDDLTPRMPTTPYNATNFIPILRLHVDEMSDSHLKIVIYDTSKIKYEKGNVLVDKKYFYKVFYPEIYVEVYSGDVEKNITKPLLTTVRGPLIASNNIWEWTFHMGDEVVYGMGDLVMKSNNHKLIYNINGTSSAVPFIMSQRNGTFSGLFIEQSGPLQINVTGSKVVSLKSFSGDSIAVHYFFGPRPEDVTRQLVEYIGKRDIPPYWALGAHFCRSEAGKTNVTWLMEKYANFTALANLEKLPYDSDCISDDLFQYINFDLNETEVLSVQNEIRYLQDNNRNLLATLRPHVKFDNESEIVASAIDEGIFFLDPKGSGPLEGTVDGEIVYFPDFSLNKTVAWMQKNWPFGDLTNSFILKDNWPRNDEYKENCTVQLPYLTEEINETFCMTIPWNSKNVENVSFHMDLHNLYAMNHMNSVKSSVNASSTNQTENNNFIITSSHFITDASGSHVQNINTTWDIMKNVFRQAVGNSISGLFIQSVPVCGDTQYFNASEMEHMCIKWYLASITLPIFRVMSYNETRDPFSFSGHAKKAMINAINMRYTLLPYYYKYLSENKPLMRPMFYDFYKDNKTYLIEDQYMVGEALLVVPSFAPHEPTLQVYIPANETFYDLWGGNAYEGFNGTWLEVSTAETEILMLLRGGHIVALQENTQLTAEETRLMSNYTLIAAIACDVEINQTCSAKGSLFIANATYWDFDATDEGLIINPNLQSSRPYICQTTPEDNIVTSSIIDKIQIYGLNETVNNFENYYVLTDMYIDLCSLGDTESYKIAFPML